VTTSADHEIYSIILLSLIKQMVQPNDVLMQAMGDIWTKLNYSQNMILVLKWKQPTNHIGNVNSLVFIWIINYACDGIKPPNDR